MCLSTYGPVQETHSIYAFNYDAGERPIRSGLVLTVRVLNYVSSLKASSQLRTKGDQTTSHFGSSLFLGTVSPCAPSQRCEYEYASFR